MNHRSKAQVRSNGGRLSVVIPTHNRRRRLEETLRAVGDQDGSEDFEVIVVDDGSTDDTSGWLAEYRDSARFPFWRFIPLAQSGSGPAAARNLGISESSGERVWLLGDDTRPAPGAAREHLSVGADGFGVQGYIEWDPEIEVTEVMRFLAPEGPQFYFKNLIDRAPIPYTAVLGSNLSAPRNWFLDQPYDEVFRHAAIEDTELAYRWQKLGRRVLFASRAVCWHHHHYEDLDPFIERQRIAGEAARIAAGRQPGMIPRVFLQPFLYGVLVLGRHFVRSIRGRSRIEDSWDLRCRTAFFRGVFGVFPKSQGSSSR